MSTDLAEDASYQKIIDHLTQSDNELDLNADNGNGATVVQADRMSFLSKLNLLGLIYYSDIVLRLKLNGNLSEAIVQMEKAIEDLQKWNQSKLR